NLFARLHAVPNLAPRPLQILELVLLFRAFGFDPLWSHLINHLVLWGGGALLYVGLRGMLVPRITAFVLFAVYLCLPHFSATRRCLATYHANLSLLFFALSLCAWVQASQSRHWTSFLWQLAASITMVLSILSYEMFLPLFIGLPGVIWLASLSGKQEESARRHLAIQMSFATAIAITLAVGLSIFKLVTVQGHMNMNWPLKHWVRMSIELYLHAFGAVYWQLGANLPIDAVSIILGPNRRLGPVLSG